MPKIKKKRLIFKLKLAIKKLQSMLLNQNTFIKISVSQMITEKIINEG